MKPMSATPVPKERIEQVLSPAKPFVSIVVPAYNEAALIEQNLGTLCEYMGSLAEKYRWELIVVNDGSTDETGKLAEAFALTRENVHVLHHSANFQLGQALRSAFNNCKGEYVVAMDVDLSYSPDHIERMLTAIRETKAKIVIASPYMQGGTVSNVPWLRRVLSKYANRFLSHAAKGKISTITGMVRAYDRRFLLSLNSKAMDMAINREIIYKAQVLGARIVEVPAHLDWSFQKRIANKRSSSMRIAWNILSCLFSGFIFMCKRGALAPNVRSILPEETNRGARGGRWEKDEGSRLHS